MKLIMYHYLKSRGKSYPNFRFLKKSVFLDQIKKFKSSFLSHKREFNLNSNKIVFTFDDGLKEHLYACNQLKKVKSIGIFFINTDPIMHEKFCNTHKAHLLLGKIGGSACIKYILSNTSVIEKKISIKNLYKFDDENTKEFKTIVNHSNIIQIDKILDDMMKYFRIKIKWDQYYMNKDEIRHLHQSGMIIGNHGQNHKKLSLLSFSEQLKELKESKEFLEDLIKDHLNTFAYPFGTRDSFDLNTIKILKKIKYKYAFTSDLINSKKDKNYNISRIDCKNIKI